MHIHWRDKFCSPKIQACLGHHKDLHWEILAILHAGFVNYGYSKRQKVKKAWDRNINLEIEFWSGFFAGISIKIHLVDLQSFVENRQRLDLFRFFDWHAQKRNFSPGARPPTGQNLFPKYSGHNDLHREILGFLDLAQIKYEFSARQNLDLGIEFWRTPL